VKKEVSFDNEVVITIIDAGAELFITYCPAKNQAVKVSGQYRNLKFGPLPPETFKLPPGVDVLDLGEMIKDMPQDLQPPGPGPGSCG